VRPFFDLCRQNHRFLTVLANGDGQKEVMLRQIALFGYSDHREKWRGLVNNKTDKVLVLNPRRLVSLWDMIDYWAGSFLPIWKRLDEHLAVAVRQINLLILAMAQGRI
jgi:hypothetical protein